MLTIHLLHLFQGAGPGTCRTGSYGSGPLRSPGWPGPQPADRAGDTVDVEAGFPVAAEVLPEGEIRPSSVPGGAAIETVHIGPYETLGNAYRQLAGWMQRHGRHPPS